MQKTKPSWIHPIWVWCLIACSFPMAVLAHKPSDSYFSLSYSHGKLLGQWDIALRDLEHAIGLDLNEDGVITWGELEAQQTHIWAYASARLQIATDGTPIPKTLTGLMANKHSDGGYAVLLFETGPVEPFAPLDLHYQLLFDVDPQHRGLLKLDGNGQVQTALFSPSLAFQTFTLSDGGVAGRFWQFGREGIWHIWIGFDHILFLLALLLPSVLHRTQNGWRPVCDLRTAFFTVVKIVTAFTIAHSLTLALATLKLVIVPERWVEPVIALSVMVPAVNNLKPFLSERSWVIAFGFGLIHGFGFASVLSEIGLQAKDLAVPLLAFNVGVELGQLVIVGAFLPLAFVFRKRWAYRRLTLQGGSIAIVIIAFFWLVQRLLD